MTDLEARITTLVTLLEKLLSASNVDAALLTKIMAEAKSELVDEIRDATVWLNFRGHFVQLTVWPRIQRALRLSGTYTVLAAQFQDAWHVVIPVPLTFKDLIPDGSEIAVVAMILAPLRGSLRWSDFLASIATDLEAMELALEVPEDVH